MPPLAVAAIGAAASIGGAVLSSSAQKKAAKKAAGVAADNTAANNALSREMYASNATRLDPYSANGLRASNALSEMLLGPVQTAAPAPTAGGVQTNPGGPVAPIQAPNGSVFDYPQDMGARPGGGGVLRRFVQSWDGAQPGAPAAFPAGTVTAGTPATPPANALSAWDQFRNSTNYQWRLDQGNKGINQGYAAHGTLQSGAAQKGLLEYNQNFAANELGRYQDLLAQQQGMGLTAASALAGVGQNMVGQVTANNNSAASAAANAALARGSATASMYGGIAGGIGQITGALGSSYGTGAGQWHF